MKHDYERERPDGTILEIRTVPLEAGGAIRTYTDVTERRRRELALRKAESEYRQLFENAVIGIYRSTAEGRTIRANPALVKLNGCASEEELLRVTNDLGSEWYVDRGRRAEFLEQMNRHGRVTEFESEIYRYGTGDRIWVSEAAWIVKDDSGAVLWFEGTVTEITDRKRTEAEIRHVAHHDPLTDLPNRGFFSLHLRSVIDSRRERCDVALLCLDLDRFKTVNDTLGHQLGDTLLKQVASRLVETIGPMDLAARLGGDEFAVVQLGVDQPSDAKMLADHLINAMRRPFDLDGRLVNVGISIGIAVLPDGHATADQLFDQADVALYNAKSAGRNTFVLFESGMNAAQRERRLLELDLRGALKRSEFFLEFQPALDVRSSAISGFEALVRWQHPRRGTCAPNAFIPLAEETGLIVEIGDWVLREACMHAASWPSELTVAVNISAVQFAVGDLRQSVIRALAASKLAPERLELEITESVFLQNSDSVIEILKSLRAYGVKVALDDFGTGFSSLAYLRQFRFDKIKIDRSFVDDIGNHDTLDIVRAIVTLGSRRSMWVTAEGIETIHQFRAIAAEGCTHAQGYLISRPMPGPNVKAYLAAHSACFESASA